jgi:hypothetical protein
MSRNRTTSVPRRPRGRNSMALFSGWLTASAAVAVTAGAVWGFLRGLSYLPTLPVAVIEGALLIGIPGTLAGVVVAGVITLSARCSRCSRGTHR